MRGESEAQKGLWLEMTNDGDKTVVLGPEYDDALRTKLRDALVRLGAQLQSKDWVVGGSQELETVVVQVGSSQVVIEAETYVGLSISGSPGLIDRISALVGAATDGRGS
jgi:hypothetical protein